MHQITYSNNEAKFEKKMITKTNLLYVVHLDRLTLQLSRLACAIANKKPEGRLACVIAYKKPEGRLACAIANKKPEGRLACAVANKKAEGRLACAVAN